MCSKNRQNNVWGAHQSTAPFVFLDSRFLEMLQRNSSVRKRKTTVAKKYFRFLNQRVRRAVTCQFWHINFSERERKALEAIQGPSYTVIPTFKQHFSIKFFSCGYLFILHVQFISTVRYIFWRTVIDFYLSILLVTKRWNLKPML